MRKNHSKIVCIKLVHLPYLNKSVVQQADVGFYICSICPTSNCQKVQNSKSVGCNAALLVKLLVTFQR